MASTDGPQEPGDEGRAGDGRAPQSGPPLFLNPDRMPPPTGSPAFVNRRGETYSDGLGAGPVAGPAGLQAPGAGGEYGGHRVAGGSPGGPVFLAPAPLGPAMDEERPWGWWLGPLSIVVAFMAVIVLGVVIAIFAGGGDTTEVLDDYEHWLGLAQDVLWVGVALTMPFLFVRYLRPGQLGLRKPPRPWVTLLVLLGVIVVFYLLAGAYSALFGLTEDSNTLLKDTGFGDSLTRDVAYAVLFTVAAPVAEELLFRGLLFRTLRDGFRGRFGSKTAVGLGAVVSGVIFGGIHVGGGQNDFLPVLMVLGVLLALAYHWSGSIYVPMVIHSINNAIATGANSTPSADWVYGLIAAGPVLTLVVAVLLGRFVKAVFPQDPPERPVRQVWAPEQAPPGASSNP